jgi:phage tail-like protein
MNFLVTVDYSGSSEQSQAAFSEISGVDASVDVIEFRQGNANSLSPVKIPGLVKHGNVTLKFGYTLNNSFKAWIQECVASSRTNVYPRAKVTIELIDISASTPTTIETTTNTKNRIWTLTNAWVTKYNAPDLNASTSEVAIESVELAYEELTIPN